RVKQSFVFAGLAAAALATPFVRSSSTSTLSAAAARLADTSSCNLSQYKSAPGLTAAVEQESLLVSWTGQNGADLRARYAIDGGQPEVRRSEEHTSELQSLAYLVCRLLLEKKKKKLSSRR